jgi:drug/metabolite transporter (DMT)-like permease
VWLNALVSACAVSSAALLTRRSLAPPPPGARWTVVAAGLLGSAAFLAYLAGLETGRVAVVTVLSSLAGAVTVLMAFVLLRERLAPRQWAGVAAALAGVLLLNAAG